MRMKSDDRCMMMKTWRDNIRRVVPYVPGEQPRMENIIKLNTNENPYPPSPAAVRALSEVSAGQMRLYPDPSGSVLTEAIAEIYGVDKSQVFAGVGSDDVLAMCFMTFFNGKDPILFPDITYSFYDVWADLFRIPYEQIPLDENFCIRTEDYHRPNGGIIFPNPNAPTGVAMPLEGVEDIIKNNPHVIVIVDEAYVDFGAETAQKLLDQYENLIVVQTFSKSRSMAGMRIGFALASPELIGYLNDVKYSFNSYTMNAAALTAGAAAVRDTAYFAETLEQIVETREWTKEALGNLGFSFPDSKSNFIFATHETCAAKELFEQLKKAGIFVRYFDRPRISNYLRITIGTRPQMERLVTVLERLIKKEV